MSKFKSIEEQVLKVLGGEGKEVSLNKITKFLENNTGLIKKNKSVEHLAGAYMDDLYKDAKLMPKISKPTAMSGAEKRISRVKDLESVFTTGNSTAMSSAEKRANRISDLESAFGKEEIKKPVANAKRHVNAPDIPITRMSANGELKGSRPISTPSSEEEAFNSIAGHKELTKNRYNSQTDYMKYKSSQQHADAQMAFDKKDYNNPVLQSIAKEHGVEDVSQLTPEQLSRSRANSIHNSSVDNMSLVDKMAYHKAPQMAVGGLGTMWLVNKMASRQGKMDNSQLYGQESY